MHVLKVLSITMGSCPDSNPHTFASLGWSSWSRSHRFHWFDIFVIPEDCSLQRAGQHFRHPSSRCMNAFSMLKEARQHDTATRAIIDESSDVERTFCRARCASFATIPQCSAFLPHVPRGLGHEGFMIGTVPSSIQNCYSIFYKAVPKRQDNGERSCWRELLRTHQQVHGPLAKFVSA